MAAQENDGKLLLSYDYSVNGYCGIGIRSSAEDLQEGVRILLMPSPFETPAMRAGLEDGDILTHYRTSPADQWIPIPQSYEQNNPILRGAQGSHISLKLIRARTGAPYEATLTRQEIIEIRNFDPNMNILFFPDADSECEPLASVPLPVAPSPLPGRSHVAGR